MRRRTITLVVVGLVLALFVVPAAASALIGDTEAAAVEVEEPKEVPYMTFGYDKDNYVAFYGIETSDGELDCEIPEDVTFTVTVGENDEITVELAEGSELFELPEECIPVLIEGPNGQVNHGQFVSNMVHTLKVVHDKDIHGPFGQWVKDLAHFDGVENFKPDKDGDLDPLEAAELDDEGKDDGDGPPAHANGNSKKPKKNK